MHIQNDDSSCIFKTMIVHAYSRREHVQQSVQVFSKYKKRDGITVANLSPPHVVPVSCQDPNFQ